MLSFASCSPERVVLWTDRPETASIVELYNASHDDHVVELKYEPDVRRALRVSSSTPDVVIAGSIDDLGTARMFRTVDRLLGKQIDDSQFYRPLLENGVRSGRQVLLPLSFNLPLVYFRSSNFDRQDKITISPSGMREVGTDFSRFDEETPVSLAFSPIWDGRFLYELVRYSGFVAHETAARTPDWSLDALLAGVNLATDWVRDDNGGVEKDAEFSERYLYDPVIRLVQKERVMFGYETSDEFLRYTDASRRDLGFRWFGDEGAISVLEPIVYVGIPNRAGNRRGAASFVAWLFDPELQKEILRDNRRKRIDSFGVAGGFSSLWRVTERAMPELYPELSAMIPPASWLKFPPPSPQHWLEVVDAVVKPWLLREASGQPQARDLESGVAAWLLQQEE